MKIIPAIEENRLQLKKRIDIIQSFWFSNEKIAKITWYNRTTYFNYRDANYEKFNLQIGTYKIMIEKLWEFILEHLGNKREHYMGKIQEIDDLAYNLQKKYV